MSKDNLLTAFITGGITVAGTTYITQYLSPELGDIFWSFPLTLLPAIYFLFESGDSANKIADFVIGSAYTMFILLSFLVTFFFSVRHGRSVPQATLLASGVWAIFSILYYYYNK